MTTLGIAISLLVTLVAGVVLGAYLAIKLVAQTMRREMQRAANSNPAARIATLGLVRQKIARGMTLDELEEWLAEETHEWAKRVGNEVADDIVGPT